jgi:hypothetical protein
MTVTESDSTFYDGRVANTDPFEGRKEVAFSGAGASEAQGEIQWPRTIGVGIAVMPRETLTLSADFTTSRWSKAEYSYSSREMISSTTEDPDFPRSSSSTQATQARLLWPTLLPQEGFPHETTSSEQQRRQRDTYQGRLGVEYVVSAGKVGIPVRAGGFVDRQYYTDRQMFTTGDGPWGPGSCGRASPSILPTSGRP